MKVLINSEFRTGSHVIVRIVENLGYGEVKFVSEIDPEISVQSGIDDAVASGFIPKTHNLSLGEIRKLKGFDDAIILIPVRNPLDMLVSYAMFSKSKDVDIHSRINQLCMDGWFENAVGRMMEFIGADGVHVIPFELLTYGPGSLYPVFENMFCKEVIDHAYAKSIITMVDWNFWKGFSGNWKSYIDNPFIRQNIHLNERYAQTVITSFPSFADRFQSILPMQRNDMGCSHC